jgi:hypothetical protein
MVSSEEEKKTSGLSLGFKLDDDNYMKWSFAMIQLLRSEGLLVFVEDDAPQNKPKQRARAMFSITKNISEDQLDLIMGFDDDPKGAWLALKEEHAGCTSQDIATVTIMLSALKLKEGATLDEAKAHIAEMNRLAAQLKKADPERAIRPADMVTSF